VVFGHKKAAGFLISCGFFGFDLWRRGFIEFDLFVFCRPGNDLLSRALRQSTIGAEDFNGRVRDGIGFRLLAIITRSAKDKQTSILVYFFTV
jgi:hypothetical protein